MTRRKKIKKIGVTHNNALNQIRRTTVLLDINETTVKTSISVPVLHKNLVHSANEPIDHVLMHAVGRTHKRELVSIPVTKEMGVVILDVYSKAKIKGNNNISIQVKKEDGIYTASSKLVSLRVPPRNPPKK